MPNAFRSPQGDSATTESFRDKRPRGAVNAERTPRLLLAGLSVAVPRNVVRDALGATRITANNADGIIVRAASGERIDSIEGLQIALGLKQSWRRPVVGAEQMSDREALVHRRLGQGHTTREIAAELGVSDRTVTTLRRRLRDRRPAQQVGGGSRGVSILGRPGLTRDLVYSCLNARRDDLNAAGMAHGDDHVRVLVTPTARALSIMGAARLVIVGALPPGISMLDAVRSGTVSQLPVTTGAAELAHAVDAAKRGHVSLSARSVQTLVDLLYVQSSDVALTPREQDVVGGIRLGESVKQTARRLGVSPKTIENRRHQLFVRLGVRSARELERVVWPRAEP